MNKQTSGVLVRAFSLFAKQFRFPKSHKHTHPRNFVRFCSVSVPQAPHSILNPYSIYTVYSVQCTVYSGNILIFASKHAVRLQIPLK